MNVITAVNCADAECFSKRLTTAHEFLSAGSWLHIDVSEKDVALSQSFVDKRVLEQHKDYFQFETHLMVADSRLTRLLDLPAQRFLIHWSQDPLVEEKIRRLGKEIGLVVHCGEDSKAVHFPRDAKYIEVLAVPPGPSGSSFRKEALEFVVFLRKTNPSATITVDGGITPDTARLCREAGADTVISSSYIWNSGDPAEAYRQLHSV
jgi:ribulose-phosphate 3-epimerase